MDLAMRVAETTELIPRADEYNGIINAGWHYNESFENLYNRVAAIPGIAENRIAVINFVGDGFLNQFRLAAIRERSLLHSFICRQMSHSVIQFAFFLKPGFLRMLRQEGSGDWTNALQPIGNAASPPARCVITISSTANPRVPFGAVAYPPGTVPIITRHGGVGIG